MMNPIHSLPDWIQLLANATGITVPGFILMFVGVCAIIYIFVEIMEEA